LGLKESIAHCRVGNSNKYANNNDISGKSIDSFVQDLVNEKIRTQQLTDEVERINREMEVKMVKSAAAGVEHSDE